MQSYSIWASLENDSGDVDVIAKKIADKFASTAAAAVGALTGAPAEGVADSESQREYGDRTGVGDG